MDTIELDYGFFSEMPHVQDEYASEIEKQLRELAKDHTDLMGAHVTVSELAHCASPFIYEATIVAYVRRENLAAKEKSDTIEGAVKGALDSIKRQVRERRERLRTRWKHPGKAEPYL
jgi:ribosome-associated translation inhibitor RaiA